MPQVFIRLASVLSALYTRTQGCMGLCDLRCWPNFVQTLHSEVHNELKGAGGKLGTYIPQTRAKQHFL